MQGSHVIEYILKLRDRLSPALKSAQKNQRGHDKQMKSSSSMMSKMTRTVGLLGAAYVAFNTGKAVLQMGAEMEQTKVAFETMTGSAKSATDMVGDLNQFANMTPFENKELFNSARTMMSFGVATKNVLPYLKILGDVSGGNKDKLKMMTLAFSQMQSAGKLMGQDLLQMINAGFNPLQTMAEKMAKTMGGLAADHMPKLKKEMSKGNITTQMVIESFRDATSEGGRFFQGMEKQSQTMAGRWSTLMGKIQMWGFAAGGAMNEPLKKLVELGISAVDWISANFSNIAAVFQPIREALQPVIDAFSEIFGSMGDGVTVGGVLSGIFTGIGNVLSFFQPLLMTIGETLGYLIKKVFEVGKAFMGWIETSKLAKSIIGGVIGFITGMFTAMASSLKGILGGLGDIMIGIFTMDGSKITQGLKGVASGIVNQHTGMLQGVMGSVQGANNGVPDTKSFSFNEAGKGHKSLDEFIGSANSKYGGVSGSGSGSGAGSGKMPTGKVGTGISEIKAAAPTVFNINLEALIKGQENYFKDKREALTTFNEDLKGGLLALLNDTQSQSV